MLLNTLQCTVRSHLLPKNHLLEPLPRAGSDGAFPRLPEAEVRIPDGRRRVILCCQKNGVGVGW